MASGSMARTDPVILSMTISHRRFVLIVIKMPLFQFRQLRRFGDGVVKVAETVHQTIGFRVFSGQTWPCAILSICSGVRLRASATSVIKRL